MFCYPYTVYIVPLCSAAEDVSQLTEALKNVDWFLLIIQLEFQRVSKMFVL